MLSCRTSTSCLRAVIFWCCLWLGAIGSPATAVADDSLSRFAQGGRIVLGVHDSSIPLSFLDAKGRYAGYHVDICSRVVLALQQRLELLSIKVAYVPTTQATRFALLDNGTIDISCGQNAVSPASLERALHSHATMDSEIHLMTTSDHPGLSLDRLDGLSIALATGGAANGALRARAARQGAKIRLSFGRMSDDLFDQLAQGRVDAVMLPTAYMLVQRSTAAEPSRYRVVDGVVSAHPISLMFRLADENLHALANEVLARMMKSGELERLYDKWFMQPIPELPQPVGLPLSERARGWFAAPGSEVEIL